MLPSILAKQLSEGLPDFFKTLYPMTTPLFVNSLPNLLETKDSVFHDPYVSVRLPFRVAEDMPESYFQSIHQKYKPYVHQLKAFERLTGDYGRSTLIATGTGSGKTECFLYPILEYCYRHRNEKGIKALIIYPMNALATDQAKRIAELIFQSPELNGNVTAGMYVGGREKKPCRAMTSSRIITDHETMLSSPPNILLTNYKMLDYLLVRPKDSMLWKDNSPETLAYIAVDELHTFDGAQGTDLACLLRRLKARLSVAPGFICCIGTSATMGNKDSAKGILKYAEEVFGESFEPDAVVTEERLTAPEFLAGHETSDYTIPTRDHAKSLIDTIQSDNQRAFLESAAMAWFDEDFDSRDIMSAETRLEIGNRLLSHDFTRSLLSVAGGKFKQDIDVIEDMKINYPLLGRIEFGEAKILLASLYALISHARSGTVENMLPFLSVQSQLWIKELRRLVAKVDKDNVLYALASDLNETQTGQYLPVITCHDCGETGWISILNERGNAALTDYRVFYKQFFRQDSKIQPFYPRDPSDRPKTDMYESFLCPNCLQWECVEGKYHVCTNCGTESVPVWIPVRFTSKGSNVNDRSRRANFICPHCGSSTGLLLMGLRSATAISSVISQLFSSKFNDDKKTLAFSDNVQDAAHRAGFFNSRTWLSSFRSSIQRFALDVGNGMSLNEFSNQFIAYWHSQLTPEEFVSRFIPPNLTWMASYETMLKVGSLTLNQSKELIAKIETRLKYEIMQEYGILSKRGRTLESTGCSVLSFANDEVSSVVQSVQELVNKKFRKSISIKSFEKSIIGFLGLMRVNGSFNDSTLQKYTKSGGESYLLANKKQNWRPGLNYGVNTPRFLYTLDGNHKANIFFDRLEGKYENWVEKCFDIPMPNPVTMLSDITAVILDELNNAGLVVSMPSPDHCAVWGINMDKAFVSTNVSQLKCDTCGQRFPVSSENSKFWIGAPCPREKCYGHLELEADPDLGYYGKLYSFGDITRVNAREHTGLLQRSERESVESVFKRNGDEARPWDVNVLSCTPTLEMGIDIGDLSSVVLCSVPPTQAHYLQRAGRAGRKDGNAMILVVAIAEPHDLYYYTDPLEMMVGIVEPPKIFLNATAVLERQFFAFCMDSWIKGGVEESVIPKNIGSCLNNLQIMDQEKYPFNFLSYAQKNITSL
ncbi:MAG: DEAD/DEAH box helicase, partial [Clostridiales bacterium]|nr:DEAD/DEAH box helicase [Clostridiales bacterium]